MENRSLVKQDPQNTALSPELTAARVDYMYQHQEVNPLITYFHVLMKRKWAVLATFLIITTMAVIATLRMVPQYEAVGKIAIFRENADTLGLREGAATGISDDDYDYNVAIETQVNVLRSDQLALKVAKAMNLHNNPKFNPKADQNNPNQVTAELDSALESRLIGAVKPRVAVQPRTRVVEIRHENEDPKFAALVVNTYIETFKEENFRAKYDSAIKTSEWLSKQLTDLQLKVETSQEALIRYQRENNILGLDDKQNITTSKLDDVNRQLTAAEADRIQKEAAMRMAESGNPEFYLSRDTLGLFERLRQQEADLKKEYAQLSTQFGPSYPKVQALTNQLNETQEAIRSEQAKILAKVRGDYQAALSRERMLRGSLEGQKVEANKLNERSIQYNILKREAEGSRQLYDELLQKSKEAAVVASLRSGNIRTIDVARVPTSPSKPNVPRNISLGMVLGLIAGVAFAVLLDVIDNTVRTPEEAQIITGLPSLGMIPLINETAESTKQQKTKGRNLPVKYNPQRQALYLATVAYGRPKSAVSEAYRAVRTSVLLSQLGHSPKTIIFTSPLPQEGKSTTSTNLAIVLAQKGGKVLIVDADMRRPSLHRTFGIGSTSGLSTLLTGSDQFEKIVVQSSILPNLFILPAGPTPPQPAELLGSQLMRDFIDKWEKEYDHIIIDTPPVLSVTDAVVLSTAADAVVLVMRSGQTTKEALRRSRNLLAQVNAKVLGVVVNALDLTSPGASYYYYYYGGKYSGRYYDESMGAR